MVQLSARGHGVLRPDSLKTLIGDVWMFGWVGWEVDAWRQPDNSISHTDTMSCWNVSLSSSLCVSVRGRGRAGNGELFARAK